MVVLVLGVIAAIAVGSFSAVRSATGAVLAGPAVAGALADVARLAGEGDEEPDVVAKLGRFGFSAVDAATDPEPGEVSVAVRTEVLAVASPAGRRCLLGRLSPGGSAAEADWFLVGPADGRCGAGAMLLQVDGLQGGRFDVPEEVVE